MWSRKHTDQSQEEKLSWKEGLLSNSQVDLHKRALNIVEVMMAFKKYQMRGQQDGSEIDTCSHACSPRDRERKQTAESCPLTFRCAQGNMHASPPHTHK